MPRINLKKVAGEIPVLVPVDEATADTLTRIRHGEVISADFKKVRNPQFHRKGFALLNFGFECWDPQPVDGIPAKRDFDSFRHQVTILAGFYTPVYTIQGTVEFKPDSLSFSSMDETTFASWYSGVIDVYLQHLAVDQADVDNFVNGAMAFA